MQLVPLRDVAYAPPPSIAETDSAGSGLSMAAAADPAAVSAPRVPNPVFESLATFFKKGVCRAREPASAAAWSLAGAAITVCTKCTRYTRCEYIYFDPYSLKPTWFQPTWFQPTWFQPTWFQSLHFSRGSTCVPRQPGARRCDAPRID
jgi:hypothetical protein